MKDIVDLRSDTVTRPTEGMQRAMRDAPLGDDVYGDDPSVNRLQAVLAERLGFDAALYFPSGTQSNLAALMSHCQRGDEYLVGQEAHTYRYEAGGGAVLGSIQPQPIANRPDGTIDFDDLRAAIKPDDPHFARTRLLALENTINGRVIGLDYHTAAVAFARQHGLALHLDGARLFNAAVKLGVEAATLCRGFDSVSICLSKGLGAPVGTVLAGKPDVIVRARRARKILGGAMRQSGMLAAAGLYALEHHVERLAEDHANAARLAIALGEIDPLRVETPQTNMVFVHIPEAEVAGLVAHLKSRGVIATPNKRMRLVTHLDVDAAGIDRAIQAFRDYFSAASRSRAAA